MITTAFFNLAYFLASGFISIFPSGTGFATAIHTAASTLGGYLSLVDNVVPVATLGICMGLVVAAEILVFGFKTFKWIFSHVPQIGGKG